MIQEFIQATIIMLAVINPVISGMIFLELTKGHSVKRKVKEATKASILIALILLVVVFVGRIIINALGIPVELLSIVGGVVIAYIGYTMFAGKMVSNIKRQKSNKDKVNVLPLIMFSASPGTIATLITLSIGNGEGTIPTIALVAVVVSMLVTWITLMFMSYAPNKKTNNSLFTGKLMGLILIAMGIKFVIEGIRVFNIF
jgi:multiple antibiotic resistance protein